MYEEVLGSFIDMWVTNGRNIRLQRPRRHKSTDRALERVLGNKEAENARLIPSIKSNSDNNDIAPTSNAGTFSSRGIADTGSRGKSSFTRFPLQNLAVLAPL